MPAHRPRFTQVLARGSASTPMNRRVAPPSSVGNWWRTAALVLALVLAAASCGSGDDTATPDDTAPPTTTGAATTDDTAVETTGSEATSDTTDGPSDSTNPDTTSPGTTEPASGTDPTGTTSADTTDGASQNDGSEPPAGPDSTGEAPSTSAPSTTDPADPPVTDTAVDTTAPEPLELSENIALAVGRRITPNAATLSDDIDADDVNTEAVSDVVCPAPFEDGAALRCDFTERFVWVVEKGEEARVSVLLRDGEGAATPVLWAYDDTGFAWDSIAVVAHDLTGDGVDELIVGFRNAGSGGFLDLDVVANDGQVVLHRSLDRGAAELTDGTLRDFRAKSLEDEPNCCPSEYVKTVIDYVDGAWRLLEQSPVPTDDVPRGAF